jgi:hypothetical protein
MSRMTEAALLGSPEATPESEDAAQDVLET